MLFVTVTVILYGASVKDPSEFRSSRYAAGGVAAVVISAPAIFSFWNSSVQSETDRLHAAPTLLWERISNKPGIPHRFPHLDRSTV